MLYGIIAGVVVIILFFWSIRVVRPTNRGLIERLGRYVRFANPGVHFIWPFGIERLYQVNITEQMTDAGLQEIITRDKLNATVDAQVYFKVKDTEEDVKKSQYSVYNYKVQIVQLARTTLRNIIGTLNLQEANSERNKINSNLYDTLTKETGSWGISIVRTELKEINPPKDVQDTMNKVVKAENEKVAALDFATATETQADGNRRAAVKIAEGEKQAAILRAEGEAQAIRLVNEAANQYFIDNAQTLKKLETVAAALKNGTKVVIPAGQSLVNVISDLAGISPRGSQDPSIETATRKK